MAAFRSYLHQTGRSQIRICLSLQSSSMYLMYRYIWYIDIDYVDSTFIVEANLFKPDFANWEKPPCHGRRTIECRGMIFFSNAFYLYGAHGCSRAFFCSSVMGLQSNSSFQLKVPTRSYDAQQKFLGGTESILDITWDTNLYCNVFSSIASITGQATVL